MGNSNTTTLDARRLAEQLLDLDQPGISQLLRYVTESEYVVSEDQANAAQVLVNPQRLSPAAFNQAVLCGRQHRCALAVAALAESFFELPPTQRRQQWQTLYVECQQFPGLLRWLEALKPALDAERVHEPDNEPFNKLVDLCCQTFVARGIEKARRRQDVYRQYFQDPHYWRPAVQRFRIMHSRFGSLVAPWMSEFPVQHAKLRRRLDRKLVAAIFGAVVTVVYIVVVAVDIFPKWFTETVAMIFLLACFGVPLALVRRDLVRAWRDLFNQPKNRP